jgi:hypothetical protein
MRRRARQRRIFRRRRSARAGGWLLAATVALVAATIGAYAAAVWLDSDGARRGSEPGPIHVHALGVNPADRALFIATHTGLFRLDPDGDRAERVGDRYQDTMGFTVVGRDHFLGSAHPDIRDNLPPLLGLVESCDAGTTWRPISLLGNADFHALRVRLPRIVGYDATGARVMISNDGGRSWRSRRAPGPLIDIAVDGNSPDRLLAASERRLFASTDAGATWKRRSQRTGLLAWPRADRLYLLDAGGRVWLSRDRGSRWQDRGTLGGRPAALHAVDERTLYAAIHGGEIKLSIDGGANWRTRSHP